MATEVEQLRDLARAYWSGRTIPCPKHRGINLAGSFVQTTFADHIFLTCPRGRETITILQRPKQIEFQAQQIEGMIENLQRGDAVLCYRCQSQLEIDVREDPTSGMAEYAFTCVRCLSFGSWAGHPEAADAVK